MRPAAIPSRMAKDPWGSVDRYIEGALLPPDPVRPSKNEERATSKHCSNLL